MLARLGPMEILLILMVILLVFNAKKFPMIGQSIGKSIRNFKSEVKGESIDDED